MADYLKIKEVAERLEVSPKTARKYIRNGTIPSSFIAGAYKVHHDDLEQYLEEARVTPKAPSPHDRPVESGAGDIEHPPSDEGSDPLVGIVRLLSGWGREVAASNATSDELSRSLKVIDDAVLEAFNAYRSRLEQGQQTDELTGATQELVAVSVAVEEALKEAAREEADPGKKAEIIGILSRQRSARSPARSRDEGRARSAS